MPDAGGFDVVLNTAAGDLELKLARNKGALALQFLASQHEPGVRGAVGTIPFDNLHRGIGSELSEGADRHVKSLNWSSMRPGRLEMLGNRLTLEDTNNPGVIDVGPTETTRIFAGSFFFRGTDSYWFILPDQIIKAGHSLTASGWKFTTAPPADMKYRPPAAFYQGNFYWGLENDAGKSTGHALYDTDAVGVIVNNAEADSSKNRGSLFHSAHAGMWCIEISTVDPKKGEVGWKLKFTDAANATLDANWTVMGIERFSPFPTNIYSFGRWVIVFGADGQILAVSETPPDKTLVPPGVLTLDDAEFGTGARQIGEHLLIPTRSGLYAISYVDGRLRDFSPGAVQGRLDDQIMRISAISPYGTDAIVGTRSEASSPYETRLLGLRKYAAPDDRFAYNELMRAELLSSGAHVIRAIEIDPTNGVAIILVGNLTEGRLVMMALPPPIGGRLVATLKTGTQGLAPSSEFRTGYTFGPYPGRKLFTQLRGWAQKIVTEGNGSLVVQLSVDNGAFATIASITSEGPFVGTAVSRLGRTAALKVLGTVTTDNGTDDPTLLTPMYLDYVEEPVGGFRLQMDIVAGGGPRRLGTRQDNREALLSTLQAAIGVTATIKVIESQQSYSVMIEEVQMVDSKGPTGRESAQAVISLAAKVLP